MKLFTIGPVEFYPNILDIRSRSLPYFRNSEFSEIISRINQRLRTLLSIGSDFNIIHLTSSGTGGMEAAITNYISHIDKIVVINGGVFGDRFCQILSSKNISYNEIRIELNENFEDRHLKLISEIDPDVVLINYHETSVGKLYDCKSLGSYCRLNQKFLIVDAITGFLCDPFIMAEINPDVVILSSHKGMCVSPGISTIIESKNAAARSAVGNNYYFDLSKYRIDAERNQTPFTPSIGTLIEMEEMLKLVCNTGLDRWLSLIKDKSDIFRKFLNKNSYNVPEYNISQSLTPVVLNDKKANFILDFLKNAGFYVNPCGGAHAQTMLRISHIGNTSIEDNMNLALKMNEYYEK